MQDFILQNKTKVYFGKDQLGHLGEEISLFGKKVLLIYGGGSIKKLGLYDKVMKELDKAGMTVFELSGVEPNPHHTTVNKGAAICKKESIDVLLAVGGGSTIDATKGIAAAARYEGDDVWDLVTGKASVNETLPIVTVLTLAATGSEMDGGCVISNVETNEKFGYFGPDNNPDVSFLDPTNTFTVSAYQTASGSADIMSHVFDVAYFSKQDEMDMLLRMQEEVLKTVVKYAPKAIKMPDDYEARANLMWASSWALNGFLYDTIFLCYPNWWNTLPMPVLGFIEHYDWNGKHIIPVNTSEGSGAGKSVAKIRKVCSGATVDEAYELKGSEVDSKISQIESWAKGKV